MSHTAILSSKLGHNEHVSSRRLIVSPDDDHLAENMAQPTTTLQ
jgi:hypothetical protein